MAPRPISFLRFLRLLKTPEKPEGVTPERGQLVFVKVAYDGVDPIDLPEDERAIARKLFGAVDRIPAAARRCIASIIGGRSGKTYFASLRLLHLCCTVVLDGLLAPGQRAHAAIIAPDVETAKEALTYFIGACATAPALAGSVDKEVCDKVLEEGKTVESFVFRRPIDGRFIEVAVRAVRQGGANVRGRWYIGALLDEACLFYSDGYKLSDQGVFDAILPRLVPGAQMLLSSTPWMDSGVLYRLWNTQFGAPETAVVAHAPTLLLRPDNPQVQEVVQAAYVADKDNAAREFGAEFGTGAPDDWLDKGQLKLASKPGGQPPGRPGEDVGAGGDLGFVRNSSALVVAVCSPATRRVRLSVVEERRPQGGEPLRPSEVCGTFAEILAAHGARSLVADRHYAETAREALSKASLLLEEPPPPDEAWTLVRDLVRDGLLDLPSDTPAAQLLAAQLAATKCRRAPKGRVVILLPETKDGRHGDLAAAAVLAIWAALRRPHRIPVVVRPGSAEAEKAERQARLDRWRRERQAERQQPGAWDGDEGAQMGVWYESAAA